MNLARNILSNRCLFKCKALTCLFVLLPLIAISQKMLLTRQIIPEEISSSRCHDILEDSYGFMWLGGSGLKKYNGYETKNYSVNKDTFPNGMGRTYSLLEDSHGTIWIGTTLGLFRYVRKTDKIIPWFYNELINRRGLNSKIISLYEDSKGWIWMGGDDNIFIITDTERKKFQTIEGMEFEPSYQFQTGVHRIVENDEGRIFAGTTNGFWEILPDLSFKQYLPPEYQDNIKSFRIPDVEKGKGDTLWLAGVDGLWIFETDKNKLSKMDISDMPFSSIREIFIDNKKELWVADTYQVYIRDSNYTVKKYPLNSNDKTIGINVIKNDRFGNIWIGAAFEVWKLEHAQNEMLPLYKIGGDLIPNDNFFFRIMQDSLGGWWFRMLDGLGYCPALGEEFKIVLRPPANAYSEEIKNFCTDTDGNVWVITLTNGLYLFPKGKKEYQHIDLGDSIRVASPIKIISDQVNNRLLWISSKFGLCSVDRFTFEQKWYSPSKDIPDLHRNSIGAISQDEEGNIWHALNKMRGKNKTVEKVFGYFNPSENKFYTITKPSPENDFSGVLQSRKINSNTIWVNTRRGVLIVDTKKKELKFINKRNGLPTNSASSVTPDLEGNVWYTSGLKICKYDWEKFECFNANPNIDGFIYSASATLKDGRLMFGGSEGLHVFDPKKLKKDTVILKIYLTGFQVYNKRKYLGETYELVKKITLPFDEKTFSFEFAALHFTQTHLVKYEYILEGFDQEWISTNGDKRSIPYSNLSPGKYTFRVRAFNPDGLPTTKNKNLNIELIILPPWYRETWAWCLWISLFIGLLFSFYYFQLKRKLAQAEAHRFKELNHAKSRLYTNITHEFRTPLTVILGMAEQVKNDPSNWFNEGLKLIRRNGKQLLSLVNQMLDLSKLESGNMPLHYIHGDVVAFLKYQAESLHSYSDSKDIRLHFLSKPDRLEMDHDPEKLQNIVSNLLSNAIKFTPPGGDIYLQMEVHRDQEPGGRGQEGRARGHENPNGQHLAQSLSIQVKDTGEGISEKDLPHIFDRFYQVDASATRRGGGTGIGLSLCKELVKLMGGEITAESELDKGSKFTVVLPVSHAHKNKQAEKVEAGLSALAATILPDEIRTPLRSDTISASKRPLVLLVEDNPDVITYLTSLLSGHYDIATATDGQAGIDRATELVPDLIVSDVMMPERDGFEVCEALKTDERTSHIPIILLTAKADQAARLEGLEHGADAYLAKPFHKEELLVRIEKLVELRRRLQERFARKGALLGISKIKVPTRDEVFVQRLIGIVEEYLSDENFGMPELCRQTAMSRTQLFRKLKAITGKSGTRFIRTIRLEKARELLQQTGLSVSEVAYRTGFGSPAYFSRVFGEEFGVMPSGVRKG